MSEQLPISITSSRELVNQFDKLNSIVNKLEAQLNFQTLAANWYGDEENILSIQLGLETPTSFEQQKQARLANEMNHYSDDVFSYYSTTENSQHLGCCISITQAELALLTAQPKILSGFLRMKFEKVLNIIAQQLQLPAI